MMHSLGLEPFAPLTGLSTISGRADWLTYVPAPPSENPDSQQAKRARESSQGDGLYEAQWVPFVQGRVVGQSGSRVTTQ